MTTTTAVLREWHAGWAPGTEFAVLRRHMGGGAYLVSPVESPHRGLVIESNLLTIETRE